MAKPPSGYRICANAPAGTPNNFFCPDNSGCEWLAGNTTLLCCPDGASCFKIAPITCDLTQEDAVVHPDAPVKTTVLDGELPHCGNGLCCPFGYSCTISTKCQMNDDQSQPPEAAPPSIVTTWSTATQAPAAASSSAPAPRTTASTGASPPVDLRVVVPSATAGLLAATLAVIALVWLHRKRVARRARKNTVVVMATEKAGTGAREPELPLYTTPAPSLRRDLCTQVEPSADMPAELPATPMH